MNQPQLSVVPIEGDNRRSLKLGKILECPLNLRAFCISYLQSM